MHHFQIPWRLDIVSYNLRDDEAIREHIKKASQAMGRCRCLFKCDHVELYSKYLFFQALAVNALLWGCESWSITKYWFDRIDTFLHRSMRSILGINLCNVRRDRIPNAFVRSKLCFRKVDQLCAPKFDPASADLNSR